ncbi:MAG: hypothetical protein EPN93_18775 [Spirochaetes bacterium]|nr:MAG: hypothetical protein EPN93_18775 [Spirochaetota bacterium]
MWEKIKGAIIPHLVGLALMAGGWFISITYVGFRRFESDILFTNMTGLGLLMIIVGAYFPDVYIGLREKFRK